MKKTTETSQSIIPISSECSILKTNVNRNKGRWITVAMTLLDNIVFTNTDIEARLTEALGYRWYFIPSFRLIVHANDGLADTNQLIYLPKAKTSPIELVIGNILGISMHNPVAILREALVNFLDGVCMNKIREVPVKAYSKVGKKMR